MVVACVTKLKQIKSQGIGYNAEAWKHERKWRRQTAAVLYQLVLRLFMDVYFSNHTFTCSMLYSPVMTAVWSFMATNRTLS